MAQPESFLQTAIQKHISRVAPTRNTCKKALAKQDLAMLAFSAAVKEES